MNFIISLSILLTSTNFEQNRASLWLFNTLRANICSIKFNIQPKETKKLSNVKIEYLYNSNMVYITILCILPFRLYLNQFCFICVNSSRMRLWCSFNNFTSIYNSTECSYMRIYKYVTNPKYTDLKCSLQLNKLRNTHI